MGADQPVVSPHGLVLERCPRAHAFTPLASRTHVAALRKSSLPGGREEPRSRASSATSASVLRTTTHTSLRTGSHGSLPQGGHFRPRQLCLRRALSGSRGGTVYARYGHLSNQSVAKYSASYSAAAVGAHNTSAPAHCRQEPSAVGLQTDARWWSASGEAFRCPMRLGGDELAR